MSVSFDYKYYYSLKSVDELDFFVRKRRDCVARRDEYVFDARIFDDWYRAMFDGVYLPWSIRCLFQSGWGEYLNGMVFCYSDLYDDLGCGVCIEDSYDLMIVSTCYDFIREISRNHDVFGLIVSSIHNLINTGDVGMYFPVCDYFESVGCSGYSMCRVECDEFVVYFFEKSSRCVVVVSVVPRNIDYGCAFRKVIKEMTSGIGFSSEAVNVYVDIDVASDILNKPIGEVLSIFSNRYRVLGCIHGYRLSFYDVFSYAVNNNCCTVVFDRLKDYVVEYFGNRYDCLCDFNDNILFGNEVSVLKNKIKELECEVARLNDMKSVSGNVKTLKSCVDSVVYYLSDDSVKGGGVVTWGGFLKNVSERYSEANLSIAKMFFSFLPGDLRAKRGRGRMIK